MSPVRWTVVVVCFLAGVSSGFSDPPDWKESLQSGLSQHYLGHLAESEGLLRTALEGARKDGKKADVADVLTHLGALYLSEDRFAQAEDAYREALSIYKGSASPETGAVIALRGLGAAYALEGKDKKAVSLLNDALREAKQHFSSDSALMATILNSLGMVYVDQKQPGKAERVFLEVVRLTTVGDGTAFLMANALHNLGQTHRDQHKYEEAEKEYRRSIEIAETLLGRSHPEVALTRSSLGVLYIRMGRLDEARDQLLASLQITEQTKPVIPGRIVRILYSLSEVYIRQGDVAQAQDTLARAVDIGHKSAKHDSETVQILYAYSAILKREGKSDQAVAAQREADSERARLSLTAPLHDLR
jgi:tetratricopeptide (TPR) repeat protein